MEEIINKYNYAEGIDDTERMLWKDLSSSADVIEEGMDLARVNSILSAVTKQICVKNLGLPDSPSCNMATLTLKFMKDILETCVDNGRLKKIHCQDFMFEVLLGCMKTGPESGHIEVMEVIMGMRHMDMDGYLQELRGPKFQSFIEALKGFDPNQKNNTENHPREWCNVTMDLIKQVSGKEETKKSWEPEIHKEMLDLYIFYLQQTNVVPTEYISKLYSCMRSVQRGYETDSHGNNPYVNVGDLGVIRQHMSIIENIVSAEGYPKHDDQVEPVQDVIEHILKLQKKNNQMLFDLWDDYKNFLRMLVLSKNADKITKLIDRFRFFYRDIPEDIIKNNNHLIKSWAPVFTEMLEKADTKIVEIFAEPTAYRFEDKCNPEKGDGEFWIPVFGALMRHPRKEILRVVASGLSDGKFKKILEWKKNWEKGRDFILAISNINLPEDERAFSDLTSQYSDIIETLLDQYKILKIQDKVSFETLELCVGLMERKSEALNELTRDILYKVKPPESQKDMLPGLVKRFEVLLLDPDYPWTNRHTDSSGVAFLDTVLDSYKEGASIPDEVNQSIIKMFSYCIKADVEYIEMEDGNNTVYAMILQTTMRRFFDMHVKKTAHILKPLVPLVMEMLEHEEDALQEAAHDVIGIVAFTETPFLNGHMNKIVTWYKQSQDMNALSALSGMIKTIDTEELKRNFPDFFAICSEDEYNIAMQLAVFQEVAKIAPEVFTTDMIKTLLDIHLNDHNMKNFVLMILDYVAVDHADRFPFELTVQRVFHEVEFEENCNYYLSRLTTYLGLLKKSHADVIFEETLALFKKSREAIYAVMLLTSLRTLAGKYGKQKLEQHRKYFEELRKTSVSSEIKESATQIIDYLEGRSLEIVSKDVQQTKKDIVVLNKKVEENTKEVAVVKKQVKKNTKDVATVKTGLKVVNKRVDKVEDDLEETKVKVEEIDNKTMTNAPVWSRDVTKLMNPEAKHDWRLLASRLGYSNNDIKGWATQHDPCMALLSEWYATHKTIEATHAVLTALQEMNREDAAAIVENAMKNVEGIVEEAPDYTTPPPIFLSYQWGHQEEVKLLRNHLQMAGYECWMDIGQMGGGDKLFEKIDNGIRGAKVIISCVSEKYAKSPNCNREVNLSVNLGKPIIPLLMEKMDWPPKGSMGPIFSEYLFIRFFQRPGEQTKDQRYWPVPKFQELLMQINLEHPPDDGLVAKEYKEWWKPMVEEIIIVKKDNKGQESGSQQTKEAMKGEDNTPEVFISYQWGKQPQIKQLYKRLTELGFSCWMDIYQMGGGDSLYDKIDRGVRGCKVVLSCVTSKYSLSANCRREVSLADSLKKPLIPLLMEKIDWPPTGPMSMVFIQLLFINFYRNENIQMTWKGKEFDELLEKISENGIGDGLMIENGGVEQKYKNKSRDIDSAAKAQEKSGSPEKPTEIGESETEQKPKTETKPSKETSKSEREISKTETSGKNSEATGGNRTKSNKSESKESPTMTKPSETKQTTEGNKQPSPDPPKQTPKSEKSSACILL